MATFKNSSVAGTGGIVLPKGTADERPASPNNGYVRYNTDTKTVETYNTNVDRNPTGWLPQPDIVREGLVWYLDAAEPTSFNNGANWNDISGRYPGTGLEKFGSPSLNTLGGAKCVHFTGDNQYFESGVLNTADQPTDEGTIEAWIYPQSEITSGDRGTLVRINGGASMYHSWNKGNQRLSSYWYSHPSNGYHETGPTMARNTWHYTAAAWNYLDGVNGYVEQYTNGVGSTSGTAVGSSATGNAIEIGHESSGRQYSGGIAIVRIYNRRLTPDEIKHNYHAQRARFGQ